MNRTNLSRSAAFTGLADIGRELGIDTAAIAREIGLPVEALHTPDLMIRNPLIGQMYGRVNELSGAADISLRVAERRRLENLGAIGFAMKRQPTLLAATDILRRHFGIHNEAVGISYAVTDDCVEIQVFARANMGLGIAHLTRFSAELAVGVLFRALHELSDEPLRPLAVSFVHPRGAPMKSYRRVFGVDPLFQQESNGVAISRADMARLRPNIDPRTTAHANAFIETISAQHVRESFLDRVHDLLMNRLSHGIPSVTEAAELLAISPRTLNRRLASENSTYQELIQQIRIRAAISYLDGSHRSLLEISSILGFAEQSGFSRWFRNTFGLTPSQHRRLQKRAPADVPGSR